MASLTAEQFNALDQRRSAQDLDDILAVLRRDGSLDVEGGAPEQAFTSDEEKEEFEEIRDEEIANSQLLAEPPVAGPSEEELKGNVAAAEAAGEVEEAPAATQTKAKASASAEGA